MREMSIEASLGRLDMPNDFFYQLDLEQIRVLPFVDDASRVSLWSREFFEQKLSLWAASQLSDRG